jgi:hypothetical protein
VVPHLPVSVLRQLVVQDFLDHARPALLGVADQAGFVNFLVSDADVGGSSKILLRNFASGLTLTLVSHV